MYIADKSLHKKKKKKSPSFFNPSIDQRNQVKAEKRPGSILNPIVGT